MHPYKWLRPDLVHPAPFLQCKPILPPVVLDEFIQEVQDWLPVLPEVALPRLTEEVLAEVVHRKGPTAGSLDGWGWREFKTLPVAWFDGLARILSKVEDTGVWPDGLPDVYIATIPKTDGDATPLGPEASQCSPGRLPFFGILLVWVS